MKALLNVVNKSIESKREHSTFAIRTVKSNLQDKVNVIMLFSFLLLCGNISYFEVGDGRENHNVFQGVIINTERNSP